MDRITIALLNALKRIYALTPDCEGDYLLDGNKGEFAIKAIRVPGIGAACRQARAAIKEAEASGECVSPSGQPNQITVACATGDCYETVSYDASDLMVTTLTECLQDDGWAWKSDKNAYCPACLALDGPRYDRDELASKE